MTSRVRRERKLWHRPGATEIALGCHSCPDRPRCGGIKLDPAVFDCLDFCCHAPAGCDRVCPNNETYVDRVREVAGFSARELKALEQLAYVAPHASVPMLYHRSARHLPFEAPEVAVPLYRLFHADGCLPFSSTGEVRDALLLGAGATIIASGVAKDREVERWWGLERAGRIRAIRNLRDIGVSIVTTPNFSLFTDRPRHDDLHSMKRIALVHHEMISEGLQAALHVNGRTDADFLWWAEYITGHPEVTHIAYEFTTGTGWGSRVIQHVAWLIQLSRNVGRPLRLIARGGASQMPVLCRHFSSVTAVETSSFRKAMARKLLYLDENGVRRWRAVPLPYGAPLDALLAHNARVSSDWFVRQHVARELAA